MAVPLKRGRQRGHFVFEFIGRDKYPKRKNVEVYLCGQQSHRGTLSRSLYSEKERWQA